MNRQIGKVKEVFIPKDNLLNDTINCKRVGFKVIVDNEEIIIIEEQNNINAQILKDDLVIVTKQKISGKDFIDIELYDGEEYE